MRARLDAPPLRISWLLVPLVLDYAYRPLGGGTLFGDQTLELLVEAFLAPSLGVHPLLVTHP